MRVDDRARVVRGRREGGTSAERAREGEHASDEDRAAASRHDFLKWAASASISIESASFSVRPLAVTSCSTAVATHSPVSFLYTSTSKFTAPEYTSRSTF